MYFCFLFVVISSYDLLITNITIKLLVMAKQVVEIWKDTRGYLRLRFGDYMDETDTDLAAVISHISVWAPVSY